MKITDIKVETIRLELKEPLKIAFGEIPYSENVLVRVRTDDGLTGYGEGAPFPFVLGETLASAIEALALFGRALTGMDAMDMEGIHRTMDQTITGNTAAKCAVDLALYDLYGKMCGQPVYKILGGSDGTVVNDITIGIGIPEQMAAKARKRVEQDGYRILKIKAGRNVEEDIRALTLIRQAVGKDVRLRVDANQGYSVYTAQKALKAFAELGVESAEQCLPAWDLDGAAFLRRKAEGISLMLDESIHSPVDAARACKLSAADIFNIKLMKCGGLYPAQKINAVAEANGVSCMVGCMIESRLAITAGLSVAAAKENITDADCDSFMDCSGGETMYQGGFTHTGGQFRLSDAPGFGLEIDF